MDGGPNRRNKAAFSNFSGVVWTLLECIPRHVLHATIKEAEISIDEISIDFTIATVKYLAAYCSEFP